MFKGFQSYGVRIKALREEVINLQTSMANEKEALFNRIAEVAQNETELQSLFTKE